MYITFLGALLFIISPLPADDLKPASQATIEVQGYTQCIATNKAIIAPAVLHPVVEVLAKQGDRVKANQPLVKLDDDEAQADVRNKQAILENARIGLKENRRYLERMEVTHKTGIVSEQKLHELRAATLRSEMDERAAAAALDAAKAELEHFVVMAPIEGIVNKLDVNVGMVSRPGTTVWGEILNLKELEVRCLVTPEQADQLIIGQRAEVRRAGAVASPGDALVGKVTFIASAAEKDGGPIPVLIRFTNPQEKLRCGVAVHVRIPTAANARN